MFPMNLTTQGFFCDLLIFNHELLRALQLTPILKHISNEFRVIIYV